MVELDFLNKKTRKVYDIYDFEQIFSLYNTEPLPNGLIASNFSQKGLLVNDGELWGMKKNGSADITESIYFYNTLSFEILPKNLLTDDSDFFKEKTYLTDLPILMRYVLMEVISGANKNWASGISYYTKTGFFSSQNRNLRNVYRG